MSMGGEAFRRRLVQSVTLLIMDFALQLKCFIAHVLNCKACLKEKFNACMVFLNDESLFMRLH